MTPARNLHNRKIISVSSLLLDLDEVSKLRRKKVNGLTFFDLVCWDLGRYRSRNENMQDKFFTVNIYIEVIYLCSMVIQLKHKFDFYITHYD